jgi:hypothetical protein
MITTAAAKRAGVIVAIVLVGALVLAGAFVTFSRLFPRHDPTPIVTARKDERKAAETSVAIGADTAAANRDTTIHLDLTQKEIRDAFDAPQPAPAHAGGDALPAAPVDRLRDRLNEGIARANRAADAAGDAR